MPVYEYQCTSCGQRTEVIRGVTADGPTTCEACGGPLRKLLTVPAILYRGSGWAKKDARSSARPTADAAPAAASGDGGTTDGGTTEPKKPGDGKAATAQPSGDRAAGKERGAPARSSEAPSGSSAGSADSG